MKAIPNPKAARGTYILILHNRQAQTLPIGKLGTFTFPRGYYAYTGSAFGPGGLAARVGRHLKQEKPTRWHIDYLTTKMPVIRTWQTRHPRTQECIWANHLQTMGATIPVPRFGASDCTCPAHLFHFTRRPSLQAFRKLAAPVKISNTKLR